jgi:hypothetical protein
MRPISRARNRNCGSDTASETCRAQKRAVIPAVIPHLNVLRSSPAEKFSTPRRHSRVCADAEKAAAQARAGALRAVGVAIAELRWLAWTSDAAGSVAELGVCEADPMPSRAPAPTSSIPMGTNSESATTATQYKNQRLYSHAVVRQWSRPPLPEPTCAFFGSTRARSASTRQCALERHRQNSPMRQAEGHQRTQGDRLFEFPDTVTKSSP